MKRKYYFPCNECDKKVFCVKEKQSRYLRLNPSEIVLCNSCYKKSKNGTVVDEFNDGVIIRLSDF